MKRIASLVFAALVCAATLPPALWALDAILFPSKDVGYFQPWFTWSAIGCGAGVLGAIILTAIHSRWWILLILPAMFDGWIFLQFVRGFSAWAH